MGRDYDEIEKTVIAVSTRAANGENVDQVVAGAPRRVADLGIQQVHTGLVGDGSTAPIEIFRDRIIPVIAEF